MCHTQTEGIIDIDQDMKISSTQKRRRRIATKEPINQDHHANTTVLGIEVVVDDLGRHHQDNTTVQRPKEPDDPELPT
jgi:hypothetical protein